MKMCATEDFLYLTDALLDETSVITVHQLHKPPK